MRKAILLLVVLVLAGVLTFGCSSPAAPAPAPAPGPGPGPAPAPAAPVKIKIGYDTPPPTGLGVPTEFFAKQLNERSGGRIVAETYPAGTLSTMESAMASLRAGVADAYIVSLDANLDSFPILSLSSLPGLNFYPDTDALLKAETNLTRTIVAKYPAAAAELEGFKLLYICSYTSAVPMGKGDPIRVPADMVGVKLGSTGLRLDTIEACGGVPVHSIPPQMYQQLQTGVIDDAIVAWGAAMDWQLQELVDYVIDFSFGGGQLPLLMNESVWNKLSPQDQQLVMQVAEEAEQVNRDFNTGQKPDALKLWADAGVSLIKPTAAEQALWEEKFAIVWSAYKAKNMKAGVTNIDQIFNDWKSAVEATRK